MEKECVTKCYDWRGQVIGYSKPGMWIPANTDTYICREIEERISSGECLLLEPVISKVYEVRNRDNSLRGFLWEDKFAPCDQGNDLFNLINDYIKSGVCAVESEPEYELFNGKKITDFIVGIYFETQWLTVNNEVFADVEYEYGRANKNTYRVRFKNLYCDNSPAPDELILKERGIGSPFSLPNKLIPGGATIEITLPVDKLRSIFRTYIRKMKKAGVDISWFQSQIDMHYAKTGRSRRECPAIDWLMIFLPEYVEDFTLDVGNRALDYLSYHSGSFEDQNIKHITKRDLFSKGYILRENDDGTYDLHKWAPFQENRYYNLADKTLLNEKSYNNEINNYFTPYEAQKAREDRLPQKKVRTMLECGLTLEALCVLNSYLEVAFRRSLSLDCLSSQAKETIDRMGYRNVLSLVQVINLHEGNLIGTGEKYRKLALEIYKHRNDYIHDLTLPEESLFMTNETRVAVEALVHPFVDAYEHNQFAIYLDTFRVIPGIDQIIDAEIQKYIERKTNVDISNNATTS